MPHERVDWRDTEIILCRSAIGEKNGSEEFIRFNRIRVYIDDYIPIEPLETFRFNLKQLYSLEKDNLDSSIQQALEAYPIHTEMTPGSEAVEILKQTIEGQHFLEYIVAKYTEWTEPLNISRLNKDTEEDTIQFCDYDYKKVITSDPEQGDYTAEHTIDSYLQDKTPLQDFFGIDTNKQYSYVLQLVDEKFRTWKYVGQTSSILNRFNAHMQNDGDFTKPRGEELYLVEFEETRTDVSERELYKEVCNSHEIPEERVLGGM